MLKKNLFTCVLLLFMLNFQTVFSDRVINLATLNWKPFYAEDLPNNGVFSEIVRECFDRAGYNLKIDFLPWKRALEMSKQGDFDGLLGAYYLKEREEHFYYSESIMEAREVFIKKKGSSIEYEKIEELKKYRIGSLKGGLKVEELRKEGLRIYEMDNDKMGLINLNLGRVDLVAMSEGLYVELMNNELKHLNGKFEVLKKPYKIFKLYITLSKKISDGENIIEDFNFELRKMKDEGEINKILKKYDFIVD